MEISKMLTVTTGHITEETADLLNCDELHIITYDKDGYGWFIFLDAYDINHYYNSDDIDDDYYVPEELLKLMKFASDNGCEWLCLDCDGDELDGFETFDW